MKSTIVLLFVLMSVQSCSRINFSIEDPKLHVQLKSDDSYYFRREGFNDLHIKRGDKKYIIDTGMVFYFLKDTSDIMKSVAYTGVVLKVDTLENVYQEYHMKGTDTGTGIVTLTLLKDKYFGMPKELRESLSRHNLIIYDMTNRRYLENPFLYQSFKSIKIK